MGGLPAHGGRSSVLWPTRTLHYGVTIESNIVRSAMLLRLERYACGSHNAKCNTHALRKRCFKDEPLQRAKCPTTNGLIGLDTSRLEHMSMDGFETRGKWWLPDDVDHAVMGGLTFTDTKGGILDLDGLFREADAKSIFHAMARTSSDPVIHGATYSGGLVSLFGCISRSRSVTQSPRMARSSHFCKQIITGGHFNSPEDVRVSSIDVEFHGLECWMRQLSWDFVDVPAGEREWATNIPITCEAPVGCNLPGARCVFRSVASFTTRQSPPKFSMCEKSTVCFSFDTPIPLEEATSEYVGHVQDLLTLVIGATVPVRIDAKVSIQGEDLSSSSADSDIRVYFPPAASSELKSTPPDSTHMLFSYKFVRDGIPLYLRNWFEQRDVVRPVCALLFAHRYYPTIYTEERFNCFARALEAYHRLTTGQKDRHYVKRLVDVFTKVDSIDQFIIDDVEATATITRDTRNYLTHRNSADRENAAQGSDLHALTACIEQVLETCLLIEFGLDKDQIQKVFANARKLRRRTTQDLV